MATPGAAGGAEPAKKEGAAAPNLAPSGAQEAVLVKSEDMPEGSVTVQGYDFNQGVDYHALLQSFTRCGFQATNFGLAVEEIQRMRRWRLSDEPATEQEVKEHPTWADPAVRAKIRCKIFFGYTSNLISAGTRETIRYLAQHKMVDVIVTTAGGMFRAPPPCLPPPPPLLRLPRRFGSAPAARRLASLSTAPRGKRRCNADTDALRRAAAAQHPGVVGHCCTACATLPCGAKCGIESAGRRDWA